MTKEELEGNHEHYVLNGAASYHHVNISIEYAISVLEELRVKLAEGDMRYPVNAADRKILELKSLVK